MTQEEKAKRFDEVLSSAKKMYNSAKELGFDVDVKNLEYIFPELVESDDEKIRKELIEHIKANCESEFVLFQKFSPDDVVAWLEKQGEQKLSDKVEPKFNIGDWVVQENIEA